MNRQQEATQIAREFREMAITARDARDQAHSFDATTLRALADRLDGGQQNSHLLEGSTMYPETTDTTETGEPSPEAGPESLYRRLIAQHSRGWAVMDNGGGSTTRLYPVVAPDTGALHLIPWDELEKLQDAGLVAGAQG